MYNYAQKQKQYKKELKQHYDKMDRLKEERELTLRPKINNAAGTATKNHQ